VLLGSAFLLDGLLSVASNCGQAVAIPSSIERSIALVKRLAGQRAEIDPNLPHANKVLLQVAHILMMDFFQSHQTVPKPLLSYLLPFPERSIAL
jgi:hypothetical protein